MLLSHHLHCPTTPLASLKYPFWSQTGTGEGGGPAFLLLFPPFLHQSAHLSNGTHSRCHLTSDWSLLPLESFSRRGMWGQHLCPPQAAFELGLGSGRLRKHGQGISGCFHCRSLLALLEHSFQFSSRCNWPTIVCNKG